MQVFNTTFAQNYYTESVIYAQRSNKILLQKCDFVTNITAVQIHAEQNPLQYTLRMTHCSFTFNTSDSATKIIYAYEKITLALILWKTSFHINNYHMLSSDRNFTNNIKTYFGGTGFIGSISETPYASGNNTPWVRSHSVNVCVCVCVCVCVKLQYCVYGMLGQTQRMGYIRKLQTKMQKKNAKWEWTLTSDLTFVLY